MQIAKQLLQPIKETLIEQNEQHLQDYFMRNEGIMFLDDELPDRFDSWLENLSCEEIFVLTT